MNFLGTMTTINPNWMFAKPAKHQKARAKKGDYQRKYVWKIIGKHAQTNTF
jgi:muconolactone delta-isomerase